MFTEHSQKDLTAKANTIRKQIRALKGIPHGPWFLRILGYKRNNDSLADISRVNLCIAYRDSEGLEDVWGWTIEVD